MHITLPVQFYRAVPTSHPEGHVREDWTLDLNKTAFVALHCWNVGAPDGPPVPEDYWVDLGSPQNHELGWQVLTDALVPALAAARGAGMPVVHVQSELIGRRYPHLQPPMPPREAQPVHGWSPVSDHASHRAARVHGAGFMEWEGWKQLDAPGPAKPLDTEPVVVATDQFDAWLREKGIDTLIYTGFATNLCILDAPAGMKPMAGLGYRCVLLREATLAVEFPETMQERIHTQTALRYIEAWVGYTASVRDFILRLSARR
ncbi:MAG TPA: cysteine hydrolase family protein [Chthonomonadaceae bacterium]|nr:cysteine hydrolase family protein [Chthonomonadaceae bacterium]